MTWRPYYQGNGERYQGDLPVPPPWRFASTEQSARTFRPPDGLAEAVNAALCLRRPLLLTGAPGTGKSTVATSVAYELDLGDVLHWHVTSRSTLTEALYRYDALGRLDATRHDEPDDIGRFLQLGPLGTALMEQDRPRMLLIDEIDKSDIDLPSDLLNVIESGEFEIPELTRHAQEKVQVRLWDGNTTGTVRRGRVKCTKFPFIVMTNNGERSFPPPFLRRCIRFEMPAPDADSLADIVRAHLGEQLTQQANDLLTEFENRIGRNESLATDQLLNALHLVIREAASNDEERARLVKLVLRDLSSA
ncbi:AAA family ATPase [Nocardiopsis aegyptia]|uniref:AAA family ATPase n=1 Tax=Nocardiopsis aegyptia TaxID=220378 RepID=UPI0036703965